MFVRLRPVCACARVSRPASRVPGLGEGHVEASPLRSKNSSSNDGRNAVVLPSGAVAWLLASPVMAEQLGPYSIVEQIGQGGFATVYLASDEDGKPVAIKKFATDHGTAVDKEKVLAARA